MSHNLFETGKGTGWGFRNRMKDIGWMLWATAMEPRLADLLWFKLQWKLTR
jgi:hypothetical protein